MKDAGNIRDAITRNHPGCEIVDVRMYDHSGITISADPRPGAYPFFDLFDSGQVGVVFMTREQMRS